MNGQHFFLKWANPGLFSVYFHYFLDTIPIIQIEKSIDGVLGTQTRGRRMVGTDETTELWWPQHLCAADDEKIYSYVTKWVSFLTKAAFVNCYKLPLISK